jgi:hypothetical protein
MYHFRCAGYGSSPDPTESGPRKLMAGAEFAHLRNAASAGAKQTHFGRRRRNLQNTTHKQLTSKSRSVITRFSSAEQTHSKPAESLGLCRRNRPGPAEVSWTPITRPEHADRARDYETNLIYSLPHPALPGRCLTEEKESPLVRFDRESFSMSEFPCARVATVIVGLGLLSASAQADQFMLVALPDTQNYVDRADHTDDYAKGQTRWIRDNASALNIKFVMHLGDLQNPGNPYYARTDDIYQPDLTKPTGYISDNSDIRYQRASSVMQILDNAHIPYSTVPGNHDYLHYNKKDQPIYYLKYFGPQRYASDPTFGGSSPSTPTSPWAGLNTYHTFQAGGYTFLNLALAFDPDKYDLAWAQQVINAHPNLPTIVTTHAYIDNGGYQPGYTQIRDDLVNLNPQIIMTLNGHITGENKVNGTNIAGLPVYQMLTDYQSTDFTGTWPGVFKGAGFMRTLQFDTDANIVHVKSYSPHLNAYLTDADSQFNLPMNLKQRFGLADHAGVTASVSFRQGADGYAGTRDTYLTANNSGATHGSDTIAWVDGDQDGNTSGKQPAHALIRFEDLFGSGGIPDGAIIDSARLTIHTSDLAQSHSGSSMELYRMVNGWTVNATWDTKVNGISADANEALLAPDDVITPSVDGAFVSFDVTESLATWAAGAPNNGWALLPGGNDGWRFDTSEAANLLDRPVLDVSYRVVPEPCSVGLLCAGAGLLLMRRRRS